MTPIHRFYIRNGVAGISVDLQRKMRDDQGYTNVPTYEDIRSLTARRKRDAKSLEQRQALLTERGNMLKPTSRDEHEVIGVASIRCLAFSLRDLHDVVALCEKRKALILCLDTNKLLQPATMSAADMAELAADYDLAAARQQTKPGRKKAHVARSRKAKARRDPIIKAAEPHWRDDKLSIEEIAALPEVKTKPGNLSRWLGPRHEAQAEFSKTGGLL